MKEGEIFKNLVMRLIICTVVPMAIVLVIAERICTSAISNNTRNLVEQQLFEKATSGSNAFSESMSGFVKNIDNENCEEMFEKYFKTISDENDVKSSQYYENANSSLGKVWQNSENMLFSFSVAFNKKIFLASSNSEIIQYNYEYENEKWYNEMVIGEKRTYLSQPFETQIEGYEGKEVCFIVKPILDSMSDEAIGVVGICFELDYLKQMMQEKVKDKNGSTILMSLEGGIVYDTNEKMILKNVNDILKDKEIKNLSTDEKIKSNKVFEYLRKEKNIINYSINDEEYIGKVVSSEDAEWLVFSSISENAVDKKINSIVRPIIIVFIISIVLLVFIMVKFSKKIVKPIADIAEEAENIKRVSEKEKNKKEEKKDKLKKIKDIRKKTKRKKKKHR